MVRPREVTCADDGGRGWLIGLRIVLLLALAGPIFGLTTTFLDPEGFLKLFPGMKPWMFRAEQGLAVVGIVAAIAMLNWKRWGLWLMLAGAAAVMTIELLASAPGVHLVRVPVLVGLIVLFAVPQWRRFR